MSSPGLNRILTNRSDFCKAKTEVILKKILYFFNQSSRLQCTCFITKEMSMKRLFQMTIAAILAFSQVEARYSNFNEENTNSNLWAFRADFLWWKAVEDSLGTFVEIDSGSGSSSSATTAAHVHYPNFKWDPGVRVALGYRPCGCDWGMYASWTYFNTKAKNHFSGGDDSSLLIAPEWGSLGIGAPLDASGLTLRSDWHLNLNWADFELNKMIFESSCFLFDLHGGLRAAWLDQKFDFFVENSITSDSVKSKNTFSSLGVVAGLDASWLVGCGFSINVGAGGALLYGRNKSSFTEDLLVGTITSSSSTSSFSASDASISGSSHYYISRAMSDLSLGVSWKSQMFKCMTFILAIDWEHHILFNMNQLPRGSSSSAARPQDGDLSMQGATISGILIF